MSGVERYPKMKLKKNLRDPEIAKGTQGFILREPDDTNGTFGVRICGIDLDLRPEFVEVDSALAS